MPPRSVLIGHAPSIDGLAMFRPRPVAITVVDVSRLVRTMRRVIQTTFAFRHYNTHHAFGQWFRFFLPWVIPAHVTHTIYVDPDVWFVSNVAALWGERDPGVMMQWGDKSKCSGTMMINLGMMRSHFWEANLNSACQFFRWATRTIPCCTRATLLAWHGWTPHACHS